MKVGFLRIKTAYLEETVKLFINYTLNICVGGFGLLLVVHGFFASMTGRTVVSDFWLKDLSAIITILSTMAVAALIYLRMHRRQPTHISRYATAPLALFVGLIMLMLLALGHTIPDEMLIGFALMGLHGGIVRALPFTEHRRVQPRRMSIQRR
jgi:hypothetical protein